MSTIQQLVDMRLHPSSSLVKVLQVGAFDLNPRDTSQIQKVSDSYCDQHLSYSKPVIWFFGTCQVSALIWALSHTTVCDDYDLVQLGMNFHLSSESTDHVIEKLRFFGRKIRSEDVVVYTPAYSCRQLQPSFLTDFFSQFCSVVLPIPYIVNTGIFPLYQTRESLDKGV
jgi:hypothetical protein